VTNCPDEVVVANWWNACPLLPLSEVARVPQISDETISITRGVLDSVGKRPVVLQKESLPLIGNLRRLALLLEVISVVAKGVRMSEDVEQVVKTSFGR